MKLIRYHLELGTTAACTKILMEETKGLGQRELKGSTRDCFLFYSWFSSKKLAESATYIGVDLIDMVKTNTKGFFKDTIEGLTKGCPGGSYIVLRSKHMVPEERPLLAIVYKYNCQKVLSFVATLVGEGGTKLGIPYLSKYLDQFSNVSILPVACPLLMSKFVGLVNEVESHNKSRHLYFTLDKFWVM